jgi:hypothetical protein
LIVSRVIKHGIVSPGSHGRDVELAPAAEILSWINTQSHRQHYLGRTVILHYVDDIYGALITKVCDWDRRGHKAGYQCHHFQGFGRSSFFAASYKCPSKSSSRWTKSCLIDRQRESLCLRPGSESSRTEQSGVGYLCSSHRKEP